MAVVSLLCGVAFSALIVAVVLLVKIHATLLCIRAFVMADGLKKGTEMQAVKILDGGHHG